jgi:hypothetical protein
MTALVFATQYNQRATVETLLKHNADKTIKDNESKVALDYAEEKGFNDIIKLLQ